MDILADRRSTTSKSLLRFGRHGSYVGMVLDVLLISVAHQYLLPGVISASLGRPLALHDEDFDLREPLDLSDDELDLWELAGKGSPPVQSNGGFYSGAKSWRGLTRITGMILRSLYGMRSEAQSAQKIGEQVQYLDSLLNACESFRGFDLVGLLLTALSDVLRARDCT